VLFIAVGILSNKLVKIRVNNFSYTLHLSEIKNDSWANGTLEDAQGIVLSLVELKDKYIRLSSDSTLCYYNPYTQNTFNAWEIRNEGVYLFLSKKDYIKYRKWLEKFSKDYAEENLFSNPPISNPPWKK
jgi:hypothetical protein